MSTLVFDIETIPDTQSGRRLYQLDDLDDNAVFEKMRELRREETGGADFMRHHLHRIIVISAVLDTGNKLKVWSLGDPDASEAELIQRFFDGIDKYCPTLVSWNGGGFDLPVLHYRALLHGIQAPRYWQTGDEDSSFRWNNYLSRYHYRHTDIMDVLSGYQARAAAPLDQIATMLGFPGKMGMDGGHVLEAYQAGEIASIRDYCETDVLNTYLVFLRFELIRGKLTPEEYAQKLNYLREYLKQQKQPHFDLFLENWKNHE